MSTTIIPKHAEEVQAAQRWHRDLYFRGPPIKLWLFQRKQLPNAEIEQEQHPDTKDAEATKRKDVLCCVTCHYPITHNSDRIQVNAKHQHVFANPHGYIFQIGCFAQAPGCVITGPPTSYFSWFPGHTWQVALCGQCLTLLGWVFRSQEALFFGLILDQLTSMTENYE